MKFETISVIGLGYIGLPTAAVIASNGIRVKGVDVNQHVVDTINQGKIHIVEPGLEELVKCAVADGNLTAHIEPQAADAFLIAVPTPFKGADHQPDLKYIESAARALAPLLERGNLVVLESTSPVGATEKMAAWLSEARPDLTFPQHLSEEDKIADFKPDIFVAHCPERVLPGQVIRELVDNDRIIGGMDNMSTLAATTVYKSFVHKGNCIATKARTAEMAKLTENASRDVQIAFANELSMICDKQGIDVWELIELANLHPRVNILQPGAGVGGHCIAVDPWFIVNSNPEEAKIIHQARNTNDHKPVWVQEKIEAAVKHITKPKIACLGLAFKPNIDDLRESPALDITQNLGLKGYDILAVEPNIEALPAKFESLENVKLVDLKTAVAEADLVAVLVKHQEFLVLNAKDLNILDFVSAI
ncbi:MAG: UDP-N-acetyl-D-mannosamine dehydrogenase [Colwellia sp.]|uniref:UDP-N-acetyl-D-mannosamine dehydrogenase n=1 Tax=Alteromonadales TaxID=135622 RepID=UPI001E0EF70E|nr:MULTISPECIES: UDP-N-acetyl-D-mannosamine dehydrogenase [Alteromonadales]NQZ25651.1 UDP-N-acetyl-D-mannosamine dehydrogenase [Colwellia sp.]NRA79909.1 UDP-N-acetyl-D-mannosamine dehydrogenase [Pseudoalteromonas sp.]